MTILTAYAAEITFERSGATAVRVYDAQLGRMIGYAEVVRGFIHYTGTPRTAHEGVTAVIASRGADWPNTLRAQLAQGVRSGRDDRSNGV